MIVEVDLLLELLDSEGLQEVAHGTLTLIPVLSLSELRLTQLSVAVELIEHPLCAVRVSLLQLVLSIVIIIIIILGKIIPLLLNSFDLIVALPFLYLEVQALSFLKEEVRLTF